MRQFIFLLSSAFLITSPTYGQRESSDTIQENIFSDQTASAQQLPRTAQQKASVTHVTMPNKIQGMVSDQESALPFGYNLFQKLSVNSDKTGISPKYKLVPGDRIKLNIWGAFSNESILTVDTQGNIFIPEVGPIKVAGVTARSLNSVIQSRIRRVYQDSVAVYINLEDRVPVSVFVTGHVVSPGRYAGNPGESLIDYLIRAGGIDFITGSFRNIIVKRNRHIVEKYDLYDFLTDGKLLKTTLQEGDTIIVGPKLSSVSVQGLSSGAIAYEISDNAIGEDLLNYIQLDSDITHVTLNGTRDDRPYNRYLSVDQLDEFPLNDGDVLSFEAGTHGDNFTIKVSGEHLGAKTIAIPNGTRLHDVLNNIPVNPLLARTDAVYLKRLSVAEKQKKSIQDSIKRLQETLLLARPSGNSAESTVSQGELQLLEKFMASTEAIQPQGRVVVVGRESIMDIALEPNDEIIIPTRSDLITINGEVALPQAIAWNDQDSLTDYIERSGGFTDNANTDKIMVIRANGETEVGTNIKILPGDEVIVLPEVKLSNLQLASSIAEILYKVVLAIAIPINFGD